MNIYVIPMFPYPSGYCHVGHARNYIFSDILARYISIIQKKKVYHAFGVDAFGLPAENASKISNVSAKTWTNNNIKHIQDTLNKLNIKYDNNIWTNTISTEFIRLNQFIFQILLENKFIYSKYSYQNWDPVDKTILSNEQVINGKGWRSGADVEQIIIKSWFINISSLSLFLKEELKTIEFWPTQVKKVQNNWINKVNGYIVEFPIVNSKDLIKCFTKDPNYISAGKFIAISYSHPIAVEHILKYKIIIKKHEIDDLCIKTDIQVKNVYNNNILNVYIAGYAVPNFATDALYGAPDYDERDAKFADLGNIKHEYAPDKQLHYNQDILDKLYLDGTVYKFSCFGLRDWCISRQRVWGCPIPILYCDKCGPQCIIDDSLNKKRLDFKHYQDLKDSCLSTKCNICGSLSRIESETLDTFFDSSWYYLNYLNNEAIPYITNMYEAKQYLIKQLKKLPIDYYIGGIEHANLHLLYTRAMIILLTKCLSVQYVPSIKNLINQGSILYTAYLDKNGKYIDIKQNTNEHYESKIEKMSKSKYNTVTIDDVLNKFSIDVLRLSIMSNVPIDIGYIWDNTLLYKKEKFISQLNRLILEFKFISNNNITLSNNHFTIKNSKTMSLLWNKYTKNMYEYKIHNAIAIIHTLYNEIKNEKDTLIIHDKIFSLILMLYPIIPRFVELHINSEIQIDKITYSFYES